MIHADVEIVFDKVIESCRSLDQLNTCRNWAEDLGRRKIVRDVTILLARADRGETILRIANGYLDKKPMEE